MVLLTRVYKNVGYIVGEFFVVETKSCSGLCVRVGWVALSATSALSGALETVSWCMVFVLKPRQSLLRTKPAVCSW